MNRLTAHDRVRIVAALVEGNSIRSTCRMTGASKNTVTKLLVELGEVCERFQSEALVDLTTKRVQVDEIWSFVGCKEGAKGRGAQGDGDVWMWTAIDADSKLAISWLIAGRDAESACAFMHDLAGRLANRVQLTSDGHRAYLVAVDEAFGEDIDYAQLVKTYGAAPGTGPNTRYSPPTVTACEAKPINGDPDPMHVSTSYAERQNLTMRMSMRRFVSLTNAFRKKVENHCAAVAIHFMHYNFCRKHQTLKTTPAIAAGVADHVWTLEELVGLLEVEELAAIERGEMKRGPYRKADSK